MLVKHKRVRRAVGIALVVIGGLLMWLAPDSVAGAALMSAGIVLEVVGITMEHWKGG